MEYKSYKNSYNKNISKKKYNKTLSKNTCAGPEDISKDLKKYRSPHFYITQEDYNSFVANYKKNKTSDNYDKILRRAYDKAFDNYSEKISVIYKTIASLYLEALPQPPCPLIVSTKSSELPRRIITKFAHEKAQAALGGISRGPLGGLGRGLRTVFRKKKNNLKV
jgi:hypothetical protein